MFYLGGSGGEFRQNFSNLFRSIVDSDISKEDALRLCAKALEVYSIEKSERSRHGSTHGPFYSSTAKNLIVEGIYLGVPPGTIKDSFVDLCRYSHSVRSDFPYVLPDVPDTFGGKLKGFLARQKDAERVVRHYCSVTGPLSDQEAEATNAAVKDSLRLLRAIKFKKKPRKIKDEQIRSWLKHLGSIDFRERGLYRDKGFAKSMFEELAEEDPEEISIWGGFQVVHKRINDALRIFDEISYYVVRRQPNEEKMDLLHMIDSRRAVLRSTRFLTGGKEGERFRSMMIDRSHDRSQTQNLVHFRHCSSLEDNASDLTGGCIFPGNVYQEEFLDYFMNGNVKFVSGDWHVKKEGGDERNLGSLVRAILVDTVDVEDGSRVLLIDGVLAGPLAYYMSDSQEHSADVWREKTFQSIVKYAREEGYQRVVCNVSNGDGQISVVDFKKYFAEKTAGSSREYSYSRRGIDKNRFVVDFSDDQKRYPIDGVIGDRERRAPVRKLLGKNYPAFTHHLRAAKPSDVKVFSESFCPWNYKGKLYSAVRNNIEGYILGMEMDVNEQYQKIIEAESIQAK
jgi:hypothetical protein